MSDPFTEMPRLIKKTYRPEMLRSIIERLDRLSGRLRAVATWMEEEEQTLPITNHKSMLQGLQYAEAFGQAAERAVDNWRLDETEQHIEDEG